MSRERREYRYVNEDGAEGFIEVSFGPWGFGHGDDAPIMVSFEDAAWMGVEHADEFIRWLRSAIAEAKRMHVPGAEEGRRDG
jgi:hypothetical protein